jgi:hypothetical protein
VTPGPNPPDLMSEQLSFLPPVVFDAAGFGNNFADVIQQPNKQYKAVSIMMFPGYLSYQSFFVLFALTILIVLIELVIKYLCFIYMTVMFAVLAT